jgi:hypothetical protein
MWFMSPVPYRRILNPQPPPEADFDTPEMIEAAVEVERDEQDILVLTNLIGMGMRLSAAHEAHATARLAALATEGAPLNPGENLHTPFEKLALAIRRTIALRKHLATEVRTRRAGLAADRAARREQRTRDHRRTVDEEIDSALTEAFTVFYGDGDEETDEGDALCREMLLDKEALLEDFDAFKNDVDRPVGEIVAELCVALGMPADTCIKQDGVWLIKRAPSTYERFRDTRAAALDRPPATAVCSP